MNDVFISYAHIDDQALTEGQKGWITQFHCILEVRLGQALGQRRGDIPVPSWVV